MEVEVEVEVKVNYEELCYNIDFKKIYFILDFYPKTNGWTAKGPSGLHLFSLSMLKYIYNLDTTLVWNTEPMVLVSWRFCIIYIIWMHLSLYF